MKQAHEDDSHTKALGDANIRPSERQKKHDALQEANKLVLESISKRILDLEKRTEEVQQKLDAAGGTLVGLGSSSCSEGWISYLDEQSGRYYWYNDQTGEAYYDDEQ